MKYYYGKPLEILINDKCKIQFFSYLSTKIDFGEKNKINHRFYVKFSSFGNKSLDDYIALKSTFQDFLNFMINHEIGVSRIIADVSMEYGEHTITEQTELLYRTSIPEKMDKIRVISPYLHISDLKRMVDLVRAWFTLRDRISAVYDLYFGVMYNYELYLTNKFLMLAQALEIYVGIKSEDEDSIKEKMTRINVLTQKLANSKLSSKDKEWIRDLIEQKRTLSFKEKMQYIYERYAELLPSLSYVIGTKNEFSAIVTSYRNQLTHGNIDYNLIKDEDLFWKYKDIQLILQLSFLSELGCSNQELKTIYLIDKLRKQSGASS